MWSMANNYISFDDLPDPPAQNKATYVSFDDLPDPPSTVNPYVKSAVDSLPMIGGVAGGILGTPADALVGPAGNMGGAAIGGYLGTAAKNAINSYIDPQSAPQNMTDVMTQPIVGGVGQGLAQGTGETVAPYIAKGFQAVANPVSDYLKSYAGSQAIKATGATGAQAAKFAPGAGQELLDQGIVSFGNSQATVSEKATAALQKSGQAISDALTKLDAQGATVPTSNIVSGLRLRSAVLAQDPSSYGVASGLSKLADQIEGQASERTASKMASSPWLDPAQNASDVIPDSQVQEQLSLPNHDLQPNKFGQNTPPGSLRSLQDLRSDMTADAPALGAEVIPGPGNNAVPLNAQKNLIASEQPRLQFPVKNIDDSVPISQAESSKRGFQNSANYNSSPMDLSISKEAASVYQKAVEDAAVAADPKTADLFMAQKKAYGLLSPVEEAAAKRASTLNQSPHGGLLDTATMLAGEGIAGVPGAIAAPIARKAIATRIAPALATTANAAGNLIGSSPALIEGAAPAAFQAQPQRGLINFPSPSMPSMGVPYSNPIPAAAKVPPPSSGPDAWAQQGIQKLGIQDPALIQKVLSDPKGKQLFIDASDLTPGSTAMKNKMAQIQKGWGQG
jgi:hypothetical protein